MLRFLFACIAAGACWTTAGQDCHGQQSAVEATQEPDLLGFDAGEVPPPDPEKGDPVARVFYEYVYAEDFAFPTLDALAVQQDDDQQQTDDEPPPQMTADEKGTMLQSIVLSKLFQKFAARHEITTSQEEMDQQIAYFVEFLSPGAVLERIQKDFEERADDMTAEGRAQLQQIIQDIERMVGEQLKEQQSWSAEERSLHQSMLSDMAKGRIIGWKVNKALYEKYGGVVIFQQANPMQPVGAYRKFLEEMEQGGVFEIYDNDVREKFWEYFTREHPFVVDPEDVNFDKPWWLQKTDDGDKAEDTIVRKLEDQQPLWCAQFSPSGDRIATSGKGAVAVLWDATTGERLKSFEGHSSTVTSVAFSPDGKALLTGSLDGSAILWDCKTGEQLKTFRGQPSWMTPGQSSFILAVAFSPDGKQVLTSGEKGTDLWELSGEHVRTFEGHKGSVTSVAFSSDGELVLTGSNDATAILWDRATGEQVQEIAGFELFVTSVLLFTQFEVSSDRWGFVRHTVGCRNGQRNKAISTPQRCALGGVRARRETSSDGCRG